MVERPFIEIVMDASDPMRRMAELQNRMQHVLAKIASKNDLLTERELSDAFLLQSFDKDFQRITEKTVVFRKSKRDPKDVDTESLEEVKKLEQKIIPILNRYLDS